MDTLGISIGDKVWTSYGTGPYCVKSIWGPYWWWQHNWELCCYGGAVIYPYPIISLTCHTWNNPKDPAYLNDIHQEGDRWCTAQGDEIFVEKHASKKFVQASIFDLSNVLDDPRRRPYVFDPEVDYSNPRLVYKCAHCKRDFNEIDLGVVQCTYCKYCGKYPCERVLVMPPSKLGVKSPSHYVIALNVGAPI